MSDGTPHDAERPESSDRSEERIAALLKATGRRPSAPPDRTLRVRQAALAEWRREARRRALRRGGWSVAALATAAALVAAILGLRHESRDGTGSPPPASVERVSGQAWALSTPNDPSAAAAPLAVGDPIRNGMVLMTEGHGRLAISLDAGASVRLDGNSRLHLLSDRAVVLEAGAIYFDSRKSADAEAPLEVRTPMATLRNVGTRYEARIEGSALVVRVRDGRVVIKGPSVDQKVDGGLEIRVDADGQVRQRPILLYGSEWDWIRDVIPMMDIEGRTLHEFAEWMARERGLAVRFASTDVAAVAERITLSGSIREMSLDQALESVFATSGLTFRIDRGLLIVDRFGASSGRS